MPTTTVSEFGDVVLVPFPFTDQTTTKKRPAVVVSSAAYNVERPDLIILAVTSQIHAGQSIGEVGIERWKEAGLLKPSVFKPLLATIEQRLVIRDLGELAQSDKGHLRNVLEAILGP